MGQVIERKERAGGRGLEEEGQRERQRERGMGTGAGKEKCTNIL